MTTERFNNTFSSFVQNTDNLVRQYEERAQKSAALPAADSTALPAELLQLFDEYQEAKQQFRLELLDLVGYIGVRFPEIKEEDNAGVRVQEEVKSVLTSYIYGGKDGKHDFEVCKQTYLKERADILGKESKDEKEKPNPDVEKEKSLRLGDLTRKQYVLLQLGWRNLQVQRYNVSTLIQNNKDKLSEPRRSNSRYHS